MALSGGQPDRAIAVMSIGVGLASGLGPFVLGALADQIGVQIGVPGGPGAVRRRRCVDHRRAALGSTDDRSRTKRPRLT